MDLRKISRRTVRPNCESGDAGIESLPHREWDWHDAGFRGVLSSTAVRRASLPKTVYCIQDTVFVRLTLRPYLDVKFGREPSFRRLV